MSCRSPLVATLRRSTPARGARTNASAWILAAFLLPACGGGTALEMDLGHVGSGGSDGASTGVGGSAAGSGSTGGQFAAGGTPGAGGESPGTGGQVASGGFTGIGGSVASSGGDGNGSGGVSATGGNSGGGTAGTGGSTSGCEIEPANPNTNQTARNLLCYLHEVYGEKVISGQQDCHWSASSDVEYIAARTGGKYPAIVGGDFLYENAVSQATQSWNAGGLSMIRYHMGRPLDADSYESSLAAMSTAELADTLTPGTARYESLMSKFDHAASELQILEDAGVVVLWAPFHESQPGGWFWWSRGTGDQLKALWELMFDDFVARGLDNLIWLFPFSGEPDSSFFPRKELLDIAGVDTYADGQPFASLYEDAVGVIGSETPIPLHETGTIVDPEAMFQGGQAPWVLFSVWCDTYLRANSDGAIAATYSSARTISRGDLPDFGGP